MDALEEYVTLVGLGLLLGLVLRAMVRVIEGGGTGG